MRTSKQVHFVGRVQGVGFRYTTRRLASDFAVTGFVRNLENGEVELVVEGDQDEVEMLLSSLMNRMAAFIEQTRMLDIPLAGHKTFSIRH